MQLLLGENGIITKAKEAKKTHGEETVKEKVSLMIGEYAPERVENDKKLRDYLEEQEAKGKIESIVENENDEEGTITIIVDGYQVTIDEETLELLGMEKAGAKPKISNIKITYVDINDETEKEANEKEVPQGTPLKITFDVSFEEGTLVGVNKGTLENGKVEYTTDGIETEIVFVVTGIIGEEECSKTKKVLLGNFYREAYIADVVKIGDFVNYSAGTWTEADINSFGSYYQGTSLPNTANKIGGFGVGQSKDTCIAPDPSSTYQNIYSKGWRILSKNEDGTISIIHAGTPMFMFITSSTHNNSMFKPTIEFSTNQFYWRVFEDCNSESVDTNFAIPESGHSVTFAEISKFSESSNLRKIGVTYHYSYRTVVGSPYWRLAAITHEGKEGVEGRYSTGMRPVVTLRADIKVEANSSSTDHASPENAWILKIDE